LNLFAGVKSSRAMACVQGPRLQGTSPTMGATSAVHVFVIWRAISNSSAIRSTQSKEAVIRLCKLATKLNISPNGVETPQGQYIVECIAILYCWSQPRSPVGAPVKVSTAISSRESKVLGRVRPGSVVPNLVVFSAAGVSKMAFRCSAFLTYPACPGKT
jgi:hypothetical protein